MNFDYEISRVDLTLISVQSIQFIEYLHLNHKKNSSALLNFSIMQLHNMSCV